MLLDKRFFVSLVQVFRNLINDGVNRVLKIVVNHLVSLIEHNKVALVQDQGALGEEIFDSTWRTDHDFDTARDD